MNPRDRTILVAEDEPISRLRLEGMLAKWGYQVVAVADGAEALAAFQQANPPRLAVLDWMMPGLDGLQVCQAVRQRADRPYTYIILLTAKEQKEDIVTALDAGADDYLVKPFDASELKARLGAGLRILNLQDELIAAREALRHQATHDALTGVFNRSAALESLDRELSRCRRERQPLGVIMADLDHFKRVNDTHGHPAGDTALKEAARRMRLGTRPYDYLGRYGGEEFLLVLPNCSPADSAVVAERIRECIADGPVRHAGIEIAITISLGVAAFHDAEPVDSAMLLQAADAALYRAKRAGRNRVETANWSDMAVHTIPMAVA